MRFAYRRRSVRGCAPLDAKFGDIRVGLRGFGGTAVTHQERELHGRAKLRVVVLEFLKIIRIVVLPEQSVLRDQIDFGHPRGTVALHFEHFALDARLQTLQLVAVGEAWSMEACSESGIATGSALSRGGPDAIRGAQAHRER